MLKYICEMICCGIFTIIPMKEFQIFNKKGRCILKDLDVFFRVLVLSTLTYKTNEFNKLPLKNIDYSK